MFLLPTRTWRTWSERVIKLPLVSPALLPGYTRNCSVTACNHTEAGLGSDTSKSDHRTAARKHRQQVQKKAFSQQQWRRPALPAHPIYGYVGPVLCEGRDQFGPRHLFNTFKKRTLEDLKKEFYEPSA